MQVAKWGNSLAVRIPADVVRALGLKEGDQVELSSLAPGVLQISRDEGRDAARAAIRSLQGTLPSDYRFDREEANAR